jgi:Tfp pilus assembly protein PilO
MSEYRKFDLENLQHHEQESPWKRTLRKILTFIVSLFFLTIIFYLLAAYLIETPQQRLLEDEARRLRQEYERQYKQYKQLEEAVSRLRDMDKDIYRVIFEAEPPEEEPLTNFDTLDQLKVKQIIRWNTSDINKLLKQWKSIEPE